jgi:predicted dehydrogenase
MVDAINQKKQEHEEKGGFDNIDQWRTYNSDLAMYDKEKLDCVFVCTQDFVRTIAACRAILAGVDVYAEKALTTYIAEGRALVNCVRKSKQIFQVGSQQRSMRLNRYGCALVREGKLGKVNLIQARNYGSPEPIPKNMPKHDIPEGLNWDAWQGPTEYREFNRDLLGWMRWQEYNGGDMTNWGAHGVDQIQWAMGADNTGPVEFWTLPDGGGKVAAKYANGVEVRFELDPGPAGGAVFRCEKGNLEINRNILRANPESLIADAPEADPPEGPTWSAASHIENFFDCMASRQLPNADVEVGHRSVSFCHLVNITRRLNRKLHWDPVKEQFVGDDEANKLVDLPRRKGYELPT